MVSSESEPLGRITGYSYGTLSSHEIVLKILSMMIACDKRASVEEPLSRISRLPPVSCFSFENKSEVTFEYVVLRALFTVPISTPV
jgi:hypothetical protein